MQEQFQYLKRLFLKSHPLPTAEQFTASQIDFEGGKARTLFPGIVFHNIILG
jgi:hypothetical protein